MILIKPEPAARQVLMVPVTGLEPVRSCLRGILSPLRLPIPPHRHNIAIDIIIVLGVFVNLSF